MSNITETLRRFLMGSDFIVGLFLVFIGSALMTGFAHYCPTLATALLGLLVSAWGGGFWLSFWTVKKGHFWQFRWLRIILYIILWMLAVWVAANAVGSNAQKTWVIPIVLFPTINLFAHFWYMGLSKPSKPFPPEEIPNNSHLPSTAARSQKENAIPIILEFLRFFPPIIDFLVGLHLVAKGLEISVGNSNFAESLFGFLLVVYGAGFLFSSWTISKGLAWKYRWYRLSLYAVLMITIALVTIGTWERESQRTKLLMLALFSTINLLAHGLWIRYMLRAKPQRKGT